MSHNVIFHDNIQNSIAKADVVLVLTAWEEFKNLDIILRENKLNPLVVDGRRFLDKSRFNKFEAIGM